MDRRGFLALLAAPAVVQVLQACGSSGRSEPVTTAAASKLTRTATTVGDAAAAASAINAFGADLFAKLTSAQPQANVVFSPASIAAALAMTSAGARGTTLQAVDATLHVADAQAIHHSMNALSAALAARTHEQGEEHSELDIANSLWGQSGLAFEQPFLDLLASEYGAGMNLVDYKRDAEAARRAINAWVSEHTAKRIPELLAQGVLDEQSRLTLVNAVYLKATWLDPFAKEATSAAPFTTAAGTQVQVPTLHQSGDLAYAEGDGWQAVELPYSFGELAMTIALPRTGAATPAVGDVVSALGRRKVVLSLPKFDIETHTSLKDVLAGLGMEVAFSGDADFSGMCTAEQLKIAEVIHQANITVDEAGTEAAAATAVVVGATAAPPTEEPVEMTIDRPFAFWLRDLPTGAVVFAGRVADPSITRR